MRASEPAFLAIRLAGATYLVHLQFGDSFLALLALRLLFHGMTFVWLSAYAVAVGKARDFLRRSWLRRTLDAITGAVFVALGFRLASDR